MAVVTMSERAKAAKNAYNRQWYKRNREKELKRQAEYWERKADEMEKEGKKND